MRYIIGIDPSAAISSEKNAIGFCVFQGDELIETGEIDPDPLTGFTRVRTWIRNKFRFISIRDANPEIVVVCESAYFKTNPAVFMGLIRVKAHIEAATLDSSHTYREVSPLTSFQASTGLKQYPLNDKGTRSGTRKSAIQKAVKERYTLPEDTSEHICDAISVAEAVVLNKNK